MKEKHITLEPDHIVEDLLSAEVEELIVDVTSLYNLPKPMFETAPNGLKCKIGQAEILICQPNLGPWNSESDEFIELITFKMSCYIPNQEARMKITKATRRSVDGRVFCLEHNYYLDWFLELNLEGGVTGAEIKALMERYIRVCFYAHRHSRLPSPSNWNHIPFD